MSVFKALDRSEIFVTEYVARKNWTITGISGSVSQDKGIQFVEAWTGSFPYYPDAKDRVSYYPNEEGIIERGEDVTASYYYPTLMYESLKQNYYTSGGKYDNSAQTSISIPHSRELPSSSYVPTLPPTFVVAYSLPGNIIGTSIQEGSIQIGSNEDVLNYVENDWVEEGYFEDNSIGIIRDFEGVLISERGFSGYWISGSELTINPTWGCRPLYVSGSIVGDVIYNQGLIIFTDPYYTYAASRRIFDSVSWTSNLPIHTLNVKCLAKDGEFNYTLNPTAKHLIGTEDFTPYITSIGLYDDQDNLLAVAKLSKPIRKLDNIDTTFIVRLDLN